MILNEQDARTNIVGHDALDFFERPKDSEGKVKGENRPYLYDRNKTLREDKFDLILTNPPFGSVVKRTEKGEGYLEQFDLRNYIGKSAASVKERPGVAVKKTAAAKDRASIKTEILFLERVHSFLKPGTGRAAIVLPDGILTNSSLQGVRDWLLAHFQLLAVVSLPQFAFAHYDAGVKASLVFLRRLKEPVEHEDDAAFLASLKERMDSIEKMRNAVAHNRRPTRKATDDYLNALPLVNQALDSYLTALAANWHDLQGDNEMPWDTAARKAAEFAMETSEWNEENKTVSLRDLDDPRRGTVAANREALEQYLRDLASSAFCGHCPRDEGKYVYDCDEAGIVESVLAKYERRLGELFGES